MGDTGDKQRLSALTNAAKISHLVSERTIGLKSNSTQSSVKLIGEENNENNENIINIADKHNNNNSKKDSTPKFRKDVWRQVKLEDEDNHSILPSLQLSDYKTISFRIAMNNAEKQRRARVQSNITQKQQDIDTELETRLRQIRIESAEEAQKRLQAKRQQCEKVLLDAINQMDEKARQAEENSRREMSEMIEHNRKIIDRANKMKRDEEIRSLYESLNVSKKLFISLFENHAKMLITGQALLQQMGKVKDFSERRDQFLKRYESIINTANSKQISVNEVETFEKLCSDIKCETAHIEAEMMEFRESSNVAAAAEEQAQAQRERLEAQAAQARAAAEQIDAVRPHNDAVDANPVSRVVNGLDEFVNAQRLDYYTDLLKFYEQYDASVKPLLEDVNMKKFRSNCQKAVNIPVNTITAVSSHHLQDKFDRLVQLLSGNPVQVGDYQIAASQHPCGIQYCTLLLAKKFLNQAPTIPSNSSQFPLAAVIVAIWQLFPDVGKLFLASVYKACPYLIPYFIPQYEGQTTDEYYRTLGYSIEDDGPESTSSYLSRMSAIQRLYSAILVTKLRRGQQNLPHPHGLENGWIWLANFLNLEPVPGTCPTVLWEFLHVAGSEMWRVYRQQFKRLLLIIQQQYLPKLERVDGGGPKERLETLINAVLSRDDVPAPPNALAANFW